MTVVQAKDRADRANPEKLVHLVLPQCQMA